MRKLSILGFAFLLAACTGLKPDYTKPAVDLPAGWRDAPADGVQARDARWWKVYGDPVLDRLVDDALAHNANVMLAIARVDEARAALSATSADQRPQVNATASCRRTSRPSARCCRSSSCSARSRKTPLPCCSATVPERSTKARSKREATPKTGRLRSSYPQACPLTCCCAGRTWFRPSRRSSPQTPA